MRLRDLATSLETPPVVRSSTSEGGLPESSIESRAAHTGGSVYYDAGGVIVTLVRGAAGLLLLHLQQGGGGDGGQVVPRHVVDRALHAAAGHAVTLVHQDHCSTPAAGGQSIGEYLRRFVSDKATVKRAAMKQPILKQRLIVSQ